MFNVRGDGVVYDYWILGPGLKDYIPTTLGVVPEPLAKLLKGDDMGLYRGQIRL